MNWGTTLWICLLGGSSHKLETAYSNWDCNRENPRIWDDPPRKGEKNRLEPWIPYANHGAGAVTNVTGWFFGGKYCSFHGTCGYSMSIVPTQNARRLLMLITNTVQGLKHAKHLRAQGLGRFIMEAFSQLILRDHFHWRCAKKNGRSLADPNPAWPPHLLICVNLNHQQTL